MIKSSLLIILSCFVFIACSAKEFNTGVDSVSNDITNAFEKSKDHSKD